MSRKDFGIAFLITMGITYTGNIIGNVLMSLPGAILGKTIANPLDELLNSDALWIQIIATLVIAPLLEEFIFRKMVVGTLGGHSQLGAVLVSGLSFGICHGNFYQFFYAFALGCLFAFLYLRTGKLRYTISLHFIVNLIAGVVPMFLQKATGDFLTLGEDATNEDMLAALAENGSAVVGLIGYSFIMWGLAITGVILLILERKKFRFAEGAPKLPMPKGLRAMFVNPGMIFLYIIAIYLFATSIFS